MKPLVIVGAGGHGRVVHDVALSLGLAVAGFLDDSRSGEVNGVPVLGGTARIETLLADHSFIVAMGGQQARRRFSTLIAGRAELATLVHPTAWVSPSARIGQGSVLVGGVIVNANADVGAFCILNTGCTIDHDNLLKDGVQICPGAHLAGAVTCEEDVFVGTGACVIPGVTLGREAVVGAGAVVVRDVAPGDKVFGNPAAPRETKSAG